LKNHRGALFEEIIQGKVVAVKNHPSRPHQNIMLFDFQGYIWVVPYVEDDAGIFLKTAYPSRVFTKRFKKGSLL
jgi:hypothetical protein